MIRDGNYTVEMTGCCELVISLFLSDLRYYVILFTLIPRVPIFELRWYDGANRRQYHSFLKKS